MKACWLISLFLFLFVSIPTTVSIAAENTTEFMGGSGTAQDPYLVSNKEHLHNVRNYPDAHFYLVCDLTFTESDFAPDGTFYHNGVGWMPIGDESTPFSGTFDGADNTISGLFIDRYGVQKVYAGLFGCSEGVIKNLTLQDCSITASSGSSIYATYAGGIVGRLISGSVARCTFSGTVYSNSTKSICGGITGQNSGGSVVDCVNNGAITVLGNSANYVGGICGDNGGSVMRCYNTGFILGKEGTYTGGIAGQNSGDMQDTFNLGTVCCPTGPTGGIVGLQLSGTLRSSYSAAYVGGAGSGGVVGTVQSGLTENCFYHDPSKQSAAAGGDAAIRCSLDDMSRQGTFTGFDFDDVWTMDSAHCPLPTLQQVVYTPAFSASFSEGSGMLWDPYLIDSKEALLCVTEALGACYRLEANITFTSADFAESGAYYNDGRFWKGLGDSYRAPFCGVFDGNNHTISNLRSTTSLFYQCAGLVQNLSITGGDIGVSSDSSSGIGIGGIVCDLNMGTISHCTYDGTVKGSSHIGGIVGENHYGLIDSCTSYATVTCFQRGGGMAGVSDGTVQNCENRGTVTANYVAGGMVGWQREGDIVHCENIGAVSSYWEGGGSFEGYAGGITGQKDAGTIANCSNSADIISYATSMNNYNWNQYTAVASAGGIAGKNLGEIRDCSNTGDVDAQAYVNSYQTHADAYAGGIAGHHPNSTGTILQCRSSGSITSTAASESKSSANAGAYAISGGIAGYSSGMITRCYHDGEVVAENKSSLYVRSASNAIGGGTVTDCYSTNCSAKLAGGATSYALNADLSGTIRTAENSSLSCTAPQMLAPSAYEGFDFDTIWDYDVFSGYAYPQLRCFLKPVSRLELVRSNESYETLEGVYPDLSSVTLRLYYADGTSATASADSTMLSELDLSQPGEQEIHLSCRGLTTEETITIHVKEKSIQTLEMSIYPEVIRYRKEIDSLDLQGCMILAIYDNGTSEEIALTEDMVNGFDNTTTGVQTLTVTYGGKTCFFEVTVYEPTTLSVVTLPTKTEYVQGQPLDLSGGSLQLAYSDGVTERINMTDTTVTFDKTATGTVVATAQHDGKTAQFHLTILPRQVTSLELLSQPDKLSYNLLEELDFTGSHVRVTFLSSDSYTEEFPLRAEMVSGYDNQSPGFQTLTVTYGEKTQSFTVRVKALVAQCALENTDAGIALTLSLDIAAAEDRIFIVAAYSGEKLTAASVGVLEGDAHSFSLNNASAEDTFRLFALDQTYTPLLQQHPIDLE